MYKVGAAGAIARERSEPDQRIHEHRRFLVGLAGRLGRGRVDPEDLAQDVLERWLHFELCVMPIVNPRGWMQVVLRHLVIDRLRRAPASPWISSDGIDRVAVETETEIWWHGLDAGAIERELQGLSPVLRKTFWLFAFESRSYKEIARQLNIAMGTVGARISRARALLKQRLLEQSTALRGERRRSRPGMPAGRFRPEDGSKEYDSRSANPPDGWSQRGIHG